MKLKTILLALIAAVFLIDSLPRPVSAFTTFVSLTDAQFVWKLPTQNAGILWQVAPDAPAIVRDSFIAASQAWSDATGENIKFTEGPGGIVVLWDATGALLPDSIFLAYTSFSANAQGILGAQIVINASQYSWV